MDSPSDKRFRSFLWSQTHKSQYLETRLTVPGDAVATKTTPATPAEASAATVDLTPSGEGVSKVRPTRLDQAAMRLSEHCIGPATPTAPIADGLHVRRSPSATQPLPNVPDRSYGRLNVMMAKEP